MNIAMVLANAAKAFADRPAVCLGSATIHSYAQLLQRSAALGQALRNKGFAPGSRVGVFVSNRPEYFEILFGAWFAGLAVAPINAKLHPKELAYIIDNCAASVLFTDIEGGLSQPGNVVDVDGEAYRAMLATVPSDLRPAPAAPGDNAWLFYTSGTTGYPKGAMLTHRNLYNMTMSFLADIGPVDETRRRALSGAAVPRRGSARARASGARRGQCRAGEWRIPAGRNRRPHQSTPGQLILRRSDHGEPARPLAVHG
jgi:long-chain acyl-CoA synthetase